MKALLVYPEFPDTFWSFKHALRFVRKRSGAPPLGLLTVAAMLPADWDLRLVDLSVAHLTARDLAWADMVLVSAMVVQREAVRRVLERCREAGVPVVAGGPLFTAEHALHVCEIIVAARESQATGRRVLLRSTFKWPVAV